MTHRGRALLLDGRAGGEATLARAHDALIDVLFAAGWAVDDWTLRDERIAWCAGCFGCWVRTPGVCVHKDAGRDVAARAARADLLVYLTPVTFGGYSSELKKALDHIIPLKLPDLKKTGVDTRHPQRYAQVHDLVVVGEVPAGERGEREALTFRRLVERNRLNLRPARSATGVLRQGAGEWEVRVAVAALLDEVGVAGATPAGTRAKEMVA